LSAVATRPRTAPVRPLTVTRISEHQRDARDAVVWVEIDEVISRIADPAVALTRWLHEQDPEPVRGSYRAENDEGAYAETQWTGT